MACVWPTILPLFHRACYTWPVVCSPSLPRGPVTRFAALHPIRLRLVLLSLAAALAACSPAAQTPAAPTVPPTQAVLALATPTVERPSVTPPPATATPTTTRTAAPTAAPTRTPSATATATARPPSPTPVPPTVTRAPATATPLPPTVASTAAAAAPLPPVPAAQGAAPLSLTLDDVFPARDLSALGLDPARVRTIIATGDVIPARSVDTIIRRRNDDFMYPLAATRDLLRSGDLTVINLEAPIIANCPPHDEGFKFCGRPGFIPALQAAGIDVATLENNHIGNYGDLGIAETMRRLDQAGIAWANRDRWTIADVRGLKVGIVAFNGVGEAFDRATIAAQVRALRPQVDVLIAAFHWGAEYVALPARAPGISPDYPVEIAHLAVDNGADLILGNHPHWVQAVEIYKGRYIAYAHGNFVFDQMWSYETRVGVVGAYTFYDNQLVGVEYTPVLLQNYAQPVPLRGQAAQDVLNKMAGASREQARRIGSP